MEIIRVLMPIFLSIVEMVLNRIKSAVQVFPKAKFILDRFSQAEQPAHGLEPRGRQAYGQYAYARQMGKK